MFGCWVQHVWKMKVMLTLYCRNPEPRSKTLLVDVQDRWLVISLWDNDSWLVQLLLILRGSQLRSRFLKFSTLIYHH